MHNQQRKSKKGIRKIKKPPLGLHVTTMEHVQPRIHVWSFTHHTCHRHSATDTPTKIAMVSSSLMSSRAPTSAHVTLGTVTKPSLLAEGWTEDKATMKSFSSMHSPCSCSSERGSWFLSNLSRLCNSSLMGAIGRRKEKPQSLLKHYFLYFKKLFLQYFCKL